ncbi:MAG: FeoA domain-containing protein [Coriobacteriales bacterium]|jgi:ferrous iron transport protein A|nr:FeoA domain-containing protein [Coriobacteriales bacterium]
MTLNTAEAGSDHTLIACNAPAKTRSKLETLGLVPGETINVISTTGAGLIIEVKNSRLALAHDLASSLIVT